MSNRFFAQSNATDATDGTSPEKIHGDVCFCYDIPVDNAFSGALRFLCILMNVLYQFFTFTKI